jgi:hypothetical protein
MKIETESGYKIESDGMCITLYKKIVAKKGKKAGQSRYKVVGYYPRFSQAIDRFLEERIADSDAQTLESLRGDIFAVHKETEKIVSDLNR